MGRCRGVFSVYTLCWGRQCVPLVYRWHCLAISHFFRIQKKIVYWATILCRLFWSHAETPVDWSSGEEWVWCLDMETCLCLQWDVMWCTNIVQILTQLCSSYPISPIGPVYRRLPLTLKYWSFTQIWKYWKYMQKIIIRSIEMKDFIKILIPWAMYNSFSSVCLLVKLLNYFPFTGILL